MSELEIRMSLNAVQCNLLRCLDHLDATTEYLRQELEQQLHDVGVLLGKMDTEERLKMDRAAFHSNPQPQDLNTWISGRTSG